MACRVPVGEGAGLFGTVLSGSWCSCADGVPMGEGAADAGVKERPEGMLGLW